MTPRTLRNGRRVSTLAVAIGAVLAIAIPAIAYWAFAPSHGTSYTASTLNGSSSVTVPAYSSGTVSVTWLAVTGPGGNAVDGYYVQRLVGATPTAACGTTQSSLTTQLSCNDTASAGTYTYRVFAVFRSWSTPATSSAVLVDTTAPGAFAASLTNATINSYVSGTTAYTNPQSGKSGGFTVTVSPTDAESGIKDVAFPTLTGFTSGGGTLTASPYTTTYAWSGAGATASGAQSVTARNNALSPTTATFTVTPDTGVPISGAVSASNSGNGTVPLTVTQYTDALSGIATSAFTRAAGTLSAGACGSLTGTTLVTVSGGNDSATLGTGCYQYTLTATDNVGNATSTTSSVVKVDTTAPAFTVTATGTNVGTDGTSVYFKNGGSGSFTLTATDPETGISGTPTFPTFTGWTQSGSGNARTYTLTASATTGQTASGSLTNGVGTTVTPSVTTVLQNATFAAFDVQATGNGNSTPDSGDVLTLTFGAVVRPASLMTGWDGSSVAAQFEFTGNGNSVGSVETSIGGATNFGNLGMGAQYKANGNCTTCTVNTTMAMTTVNNRSVVTITFGSSPSGLNSSSGTKTLTWATTTNARDWGNNAGTTGTATETGPADADF
jgi:hypothetical protein